MNYFDALKIYNEGKPAWCSPRRGTFEYKAVIAIMKGTSVSPPKKDSDAGSMSMGSSSSSSSPKPPKPKRKYTRKPKAPSVDSGSAPAPAPKKRGRPPKICYDKDGNIIHKAPRKARVARTPAGSLAGSATLVYPKSSSSKKSRAPSVGSAGFFGVSSRSLPMTSTSSMTAKSASMMGSTTMSMARNISLPKSSTPPAPPKRRAGNPVGRPRKQAGAPKGKYTRKPKTLMNMGQAVPLPKSSRSTARSGSGQFV